MRGRIVSVWGKRSLPAIVGLGLLAGAARDARADANRVKGTIGGAMIGAEVVMLTESAFRLRPTWMYLAGGAGGGLLGGYVGNRMSGDSNRPPSFLLAGGIALIIPTIMGVLTATQYEPIGTIRQDSPADGSGAGSDDDGEPGDPDAADPDASDGADPEGPSSRYPAPRLELPAIGLAQAFSRDELAHFRVRQATEVHVSLLRGVF